MSARTLGDPPGQAGVGAGLKSGTQAVDHDPVCKRTSNSGAASAVAIMR
jgi:hypothetical protein